MRANELFVIGIGKDPTHIDACTRTYKKPDALFTVNSTNYVDPETRDTAFGEFLTPPESMPLSEPILHSILAVDNYLPPEFLHPDVPRETLLRSIGNFRRAFLDCVASAGRKKVVMNTYFNSPFVENFRKQGYIVTGPNEKIVEQFSSKTMAYRLAQSLGIPVPEGNVVDSLDSVATLFKELVQKYGSAFVSSDKGSGGKNSLRISNVEQLRAFNEHPPFLVTGWMEKLASPNSLVLIGNDQVLYVGLTDQIIKKDVLYYGNSYPSKLAPDQQQRIETFSLMLGRAMQKRGYRGFAGFDWIATAEGAEYFSEINPRKNRSSSMLISYLDTHRDPGTPSLTELEMLTTLGEEWNTLPESSPPNLHWAMQLYKTHGKAVVKNTIRPQFDDRSIFQGAGNDDRVSILNFPRAGTTLSQFPQMHDLARIIAVGRSGDAVSQLIATARATIRDSYQKKS